MLEARTRKTPTLELGAGITRARARMSSRDPRPRWRRGAPARVWDSGAPTAAGGRTARRTREGPTDAEIERGLRERAVSDPRAAEILLRWLQHPRTQEPVAGVDLEALSDHELARLHTGSHEACRLAYVELQALVGSLLVAGESPSGHPQVRDPA